MGESGYTTLKNIDTIYVTRSPYALVENISDLTALDWSQIPDPTFFRDVLKSKLRALPLTRAAH